LALLYASGSREKRKKGLGRGVFSLGEKRERDKKKREAGSTKRVPARRGTRSQQESVVINRKKVCSPHASVERKKKKRNKGTILASYSEKEKEEPANGEAQNYRTSAEHGERGRSRGVYS